MGVILRASLVFLGTGTGPFVVGKNLRGAGGIILKIDDNQFHIDPGPGALHQMASSRINVRETTAVLASHHHLYHCNDLNAVIDGMTYSGLDKIGVLVCPSSFVENFPGENRVGKYPLILRGKYKEFLERVIALEAGQRVGINEIEVLGLAAEHGCPTIGFKFFTPYFTLAYTSDTRLSADIVKQLKNANILVLNVPFFRRGEGKNNLSVEDAEEIIREVKPNVAILTHFGIEMLKADPLYQAREVQKKTGVQTIAARDGMEIDLLSYAVDKGQRTLEGFQVYTLSDKPDDEGAEKTASG